LIIENILRPSENCLIVNLNRHDSPKLKQIYCIEQIINDSLQICSLSNTFNQLIPGTIYNISVTIHRDSYENLFNWEKQTVFKLVNTSKLEYFILNFYSYQINQKIYHHYEFVLGKQMKIVV
jgi:hypothetical protein